MAVTSRCGKEQQQLLEGIVTYCDDRLARVWIETVKSEKEINFAYRSRHFNLGDWLLVSLTTDEAHEITPLLETRVLKIGVAQVASVFDFVLNFYSDNTRVFHFQAQSCKKQSFMNCLSFSSFISNSSFRYARGPNDLFS
ncbi:hypothetical protein ACH3XW_35905 [Acanthocheilonema viteae]